MYRNEHKNYMFKKIWKVSQKKTKKLEFCFKRNDYYLHRYERDEAAKLCKVLQILAQSSLSRIVLRESNKKESLGNSIYDLVFYESGRQDSNLRPSAPKAPALPSCATPR